MTAHILGPLACESCAVIDRAYSKSETLPPVVQNRSDLRLSFALVSNLAGSNLDIDVLFSLKILQAFAQFVDVGLSGNSKVCFKLEERRAAHRCGVRFRLHRLDVDTHAAQDTADLVDDAGVIHTGSRKPVWQKIRNPSL